MLNESTGSFGNEKDVKLNDKPDEITFNALLKVKTDPESALNDRYFFKRNLTNERDLNFPLTERRKSLNLGGIITGKSFNPMDREGHPGEVAPKLMILRAGKIRTRKTIIIRAGTI